VSAKINQRGERNAGKLSKEQLKLIDAYWRAANYLSVAKSIFTIIAAEKAAD